MDGAVTIIDGVAGVQAQTLTVWRQALRQNVAQVIYVNKLDREGASLERACATIRDRLGVRPLVLQMPISDDNLTVASSAVVDLVTVELVEWSGRDGETVTRRPLSSVQGSEILLERALLARERLLEELAECDDEFADLYLTAADANDADGNEFGSSIDSEAIVSALRRITANVDSRDRGCAVLCGASLRNVGVQTLLDTMADLLPSPNAGPPVVATPLDDPSTTTTRAPSVGDPTCGLAFKVIHTQDSQRRPLVLVRVISGSIEAGSMVLNTDTGKRERVARVLQVAAGHVIEADSVSEGNVAALVGLSGTRTGDTLCYGGKGNAASAVRLRGMVPPPPVFTSAFEVSSSTEEDALREVLQQLCLEDPSVHLVSEGGVERVDGSTPNATSSALASGDSRIVVGGMGELHLDLLLDRIQRQYKLPHVRMSSLRVAYRETISKKHEREYTYERRVGDKLLAATVQIVVEPQQCDENELTVDSHLTGGNEEHGDEPLSLTYVEAAKQGMEDAMFSGPILGFPVTGVRARVVRAEPGAECNPAIARACVAMGTLAALLDAEPALLEPTMKLELEMPEERMGAVLSDLNAQRRAIIRSFGASGQEAGADEDDESGGSLSMSSVEAQVPLPELLGYASQLRSLTAGEASYSMEFASYEEVPSPILKKMLSSGEYF